MTFKVGDKVKCINVDDIKYLTLGGIYTITRYFEDTNLVSVYELPLHILSNGSRFELYEPGHLVTTPSLYYNLEPVQADFELCESESGSLVWLFDVWGMDEVNPLVKGHGVTLEEALEKCLELVKGLRSTYCASPGANAQTVRECEGLSAKPAQ